MGSRQRGGGERPPLLLLVPGCLHISVSLAGFLNPLQTVPPSMPFEPSEWKVYAVGTSMASQHPSSNCSLKSEIVKSLSTPPALLRPFWLSEPCVLFLLRLARVGFLSLGTKGALTLCPGGHPSLLSPLCLPLHQRWGDPARALCGCLPRAHASVTLPR